MCTSLPTIKLLQLYYGYKITLHITLLKITKDSSVNFLCFDFGNWEETANDRSVSRSQILVETATFGRLQNRRSHTVECCRKIKGQFIFIWSTIDTPLLTVTFASGRKLICSTTSNSSHSWQYGSLRHGKSGQTKPTITFYRKCYWVSMGYISKYSQSESSRITFKGHRHVRITLQSIKNKLVGINGSLSVTFARLFLLGH